NKLPAHANELIDRYYMQAAGFLSDSDFKYYWFTFEKNVKGWQSVTDYVQSFPPETLRQEDQFKARVRVGLHANLVSASVCGMIAHLGMAEGHRASFDKDAAVALETYKDADFSFAMPDWDQFNESPPLHGA
ncbi:MAG: hypothetical protein JWP99_1127, partial [Devosia sp.]|nr:hypothetical protein [Devosia sp.]